MVNEVDTENNINITREMNDAEYAQSLIDRANQEAMVAARNAE
jgi:hypothetical protein